MAGSRVSAGGVSVDLIGLDDAVRGIIDRAMPGVVSRMEREADDLMLEIVDSWPVLTGESRASFYRETSIRKDDVVVRIDNRESRWIWVRWSRFTRAEMEEAIALLRDGPTSQEYAWMSKTSGQEIASRWPELRWKWLQTQSLRTVRRDYPELVDYWRLWRGLVDHGWKPYPAPRDEWAGRRPYDVARTALNKRAEVVAADLADVFAGAAGR